MGIHFRTYSFAVLAKPAQAALLGAQRSKGTRHPATRLIELAVRSGQVDPQDVQAFIQRHKLFVQHIPLISTYAEGASVLAIEKMNRTPTITGLLSQLGIDGFERIGLITRIRGNRRYILGKSEKLRYFTIVATFKAIPAFIPPEDTLPLFKRSPVLFDQVTRGGRRVLIEAAAKELEKPSWALSSSDFNRQLNIFGNKSLSGLMSHYELQYSGVSHIQIVVIMKKALGIRPVEFYTFEEALRLFKKSHYPNFWDMVRPEDQRKFVELAADEIGKLPGALNATAFTKPLKIFGGKSLCGFLQHYRSRHPDISDIQILVIVYEALGIKPVEFYTFEEALNLFKKSHCRDFWEKVKPKDQRRFVELAAEERGRTSGALSTADLFRPLKVFGGKGLRGLYDHYRLQHPDLSYVQAIAIVNKALGIQPVKFYTSEEALRLFKKTHYPNFWDMVRLKDQKKFAELAVDEIGKQPCDLNTSDFFRQFKVLGGKSLAGLLKHYRSQHPGESFVQTVERMKKVLGIMAG